MIRSEGTATHVRLEELEWCLARVAQSEKKPPPPGMKVLWNSRELLEEEIRKEREDMHKNRKAKGDYMELQGEMPEMDHSRPDARLGSGGAVMAAVE